jgi:hypothetical protein
MVYHQSATTLRINAAYLLVNNRLLSSNPTPMWASLFHVPRNTVAACDNTQYGLPCRS